MPALSGILRVFSLRIPISAFNSVQHAYVSRNMLFRKFFFSTLWGTLLSGVLGIVAAYLGMGAWALIIQYMSNTIVDTIVLSFTIKWRPRLVFSIASAKKLMQYGWKILLADLSGTFFEQLRSLIIGKVYTTGYCKTTGKCLIDGKVETSYSFFTIIGCFIWYRLNWEY